MAYKKKLIEVALPLQTISKEAAREKSIRHGHPSTLHLWWARRPLAAARAVLWASLVDDPSAHPGRFPTEQDQSDERKRLFETLTDLVKWKNTNNVQVLSAAKAEILASCDGELPNILDPFCGGGTIPLEAQRLGLPAYGGDLNPVAVLISKAMVEIPPRFAGIPPINPEAGNSMDVGSWEGARGLAEDIVYYGRWVRDQALKRIGHLYPRAQVPEGVGGRRETVIAWIWARTVQSPDPAWDGHVPLVGSWVLRRRPGKPWVWVKPLVDHDTQTISYQIREGGTPPKGTVKRAVGTCIATGATIPNAYIKEEGQAGRMGQHLIAVVCEGHDGRRYLPPESTPHVEVPIPEWEPRGRLDGKAGDQMPLYGSTHWRHLFTDRQLVALTTFSDLLLEVRSSIEQDARKADLPADNRPLRQGGSGANAYGEALLTFLAFALDRCAVRWSECVPWHAGRETVEHVFGRQAIAMVWYFPEANPFSSSTGNWLGQLTWIGKVVENLPAQGLGEVFQQDARARLSSVPNPVVTTDPPYYDNICYADISDFFYVWLRHNLRSIWPDELSTLATPKAEELIASAYRHQSKTAAAHFFESGMREVLGEAAQVQHPDFPVSIFYAFKQAETKKGETVSTGWQTFLQALNDTGLRVLATWPMRTEMTSGLRSLASTLASSIVIVCRPRPANSPLATRGELLAALRSELPSAMRLLREQAIAPVDMDQSMIGPGMAVFSRYSRVLNADGTAMSVRQALALIDQIKEETLSEEETEFDYETRWALTWYRQFGADLGSYGDAETLSKAKNTSVSSVVRAGIATSVAGKVQLVPRADLNPNWDPRADPSPKVWQVTQHLLDRLERSETEAADLLRQAGSGMGDRARQLAYLLYQTADRRGWAQERIVYNMLVTVWPTLVDLAAQPSPGQGSLLEA